MEPTVLSAFDGHGPGAVTGLQTEDLNVTVVAWPEGRGVEPHANAELDVVSIVVSGIGEIRMGDQTFELATGSIVVIPKGVVREIRSRSHDFRYVNLHKRRRALMPG